MTVYAAECVTYFFFFPFTTFFFGLSPLLDEVNDSAQYSALGGSGGISTLSSGGMPSKIDVRTPNVALYGAIAGGGTFGG